MSLFEALESLDLSRAREILKSDPDQVSHRDNNGAIPLHLAAEVPDVTLFVEILNADSSLIDTPDHLGFTPLFTAVSAGHVDILQLLIRRGTQLDHVDINRRTAVHWAVVTAQVII